MVHRIWSTFTSPGSTHNVPLRSTDTQLSSGHVQPKERHRATSASRKNCMIRALFFPIVPIFPIVPHRTAMELIMAAAARFRPAGAAQLHHLTIPVIATYLGVAPASLHGWIAPEGAGGAESRSLHSRVPSASPGRNCTCDAGYDFDAQNSLPDSKRKATAVRMVGSTTLACCRHPRSA